jgi:hypothetical protein
VQPSVRLPLRVEILRGKEESDSKSTAAMVATSSPDVRIWKLPAFPPFADPRRVALLYPSPQSVPVTSLDAADFDALLVIDTTWSRAGGVLQMPQLAAPFVHVHLQGEFPRGGPHTIFWRHQPLGPSCLSTAEALYFALRGLEVGRKKRELAAAHGSGGGGGGAPDPAAGVGAAENLASSDGLYDGRYDDLLLFFMATYHRVQHEYTAGSRAGEAFTKKQRAGYIRGATGAEPEGGGGGGGGNGDGGGSDDDEGAAPPRAQQRRKRQRLKGGWALRQDALDPRAALLKASTEERFALSNLPRAATARPEELRGKEEEVYYALVREQQHEYAQKKKARGAEGGAAGAPGV